MIGAAVDEWRSLKEKEEKNQYKLFEHCGSGAGGESTLTGAIVGNGATGVRRVQRSASWQGQQALRSDASSRAGDAVAVLASTRAHHRWTRTVSHALVQATWLLTEEPLAVVEPFKLAHTPTRIYFTAQKSFIVYRKLKLRQMKMDGASISLHPFAIPIF